jgi:hypothetical protein
MKYRRTWPADSIISILGDANTSTRTSVARKGEIPLPLLLKSSRKHSLPFGSVQTICGVEQASFALICLAHCTKPRMLKTFDTAKVFRRLYALYAQRSIAPSICILFDIDNLSQELIRELKPHLKHGACLYTGRRAERSALSGCDLHPTRMGNDRTHCRIHRVWVLQNLWTISRFGRDRD